MDGVGGQLFLAGHLAGQRLDGGDRLHLLGVIHDRVVAAGHFLLGQSGHGEERGGGKREGQFHRVASFGS